MNWRVGPTLVIGSKLQKIKKKSNYFLAPINTKSIQLPFVAKSCKNETKTSI